MRRFLHSAYTCVLLAASVACGSSNATDPTASGATSGSGNPTVAATGTGAGGTTTTSGNGGDTSGAGGGNSASASSTGSGGAMGTYTIDSTVPDWQNPAHKTSLRFAPLDGLQPLVLTEIGKAQKTLRLAFFNIRTPEVITLLSQKVKAGVDVKVLLDKKQQDQVFNTGYEDLTAAGVPVALIDNQRAMDATMHDKFTIIDGLRVLAGSANYSYTALNDSDEDLLEVEDAGLAARYQVEFDQLSKATKTKSAAYAGEKVQTFFGPQDGLSPRVVGALDAVKSTAVVAMFDLNDQNIVNALITAKKRGVVVVVVMDKVQADAMGATAATTLANANVTVVKADNTNGQQAEMHSKFLVVDHQKLLLGSYNWTNLGTFYNDENMLTIDDPILSARGEGKLAQLLQTYKAPPAAQLGLTTGKQSVTFKLANVVVSGNFAVRIHGEAGGPFDPPKTLTDGSLTVDIDAGKRVNYAYDIMDGAKFVTQELGGKKLPHFFTVPYAPGPFTVNDVYQK